MSLLVKSRCEYTQDLKPQTKLTREFTAHEIGITYGNAGIMYFFTERKCERSREDSEVVEAI